MPLTQVYNNLNLEVCDSFLCIGYANIIRVFAIVGTPVCNITLLNDFYDFKITDHWVYVSVTTSTDQYDIGSCMLFGTTSTTSAMNILVH